MCGLLEGNIYFILGVIGCVAKCENFEMYIINNIMFRVFIHIHLYKILNSFEKIQLRLTLNNTLSKLIKQNFCQKNTHHGVYC